MRPWLRFLDIIWIYSLWTQKMLSNAIIQNNHVYDEIPGSQDIMRNINYTSLTWEYDNPFSSTSSSHGCSPSMSSSSSTSNGQHNKYSSTLRAIFYDPIIESSLRKQQYIFLYHVLLKDSQNRRHISITHISLGWCQTPILLW